MVVPTQNHLTLKWGTLKGYNFKDQDCLNLVWKYQELGQNYSSMRQNDTDEQEKLLCDLCDLVEKVDGTIYLDWDGKYVTAEEAKTYLREYAKK